MRSLTELIRESYAPDNVLNEESYELIMLVRLLEEYKIQNVQDLSRALQNLR